MIIDTDLGTILLTHQIVNENMTATRPGIAFRMLKQTDFIIYDYKIMIEKYVTTNYAVTDGGTNYVATFNVIPNHKSVAKSPTLLLGQFKANNTMINSANTSVTLTPSTTYGDAGRIEVIDPVPVTVTLPKAAGAAQARAVMWSDLATAPIVAYDNMLTTP